jgi:SAM-dependent methyltransferase
VSDRPLIFYLRTARNKARAVAILEAVSLLRDMHATAPVGGPLSEQGGLFWIALPDECLKDALALFPRLGYTNAVDMLEPLNGQEADAGDTSPAEYRLVRWRHKPYRLVRLYEENAESLRESAPDRRPFLLETRGGEVRLVQGYRGDGYPLSRRGLPVYDARMLVNLVVSVGAGIHFLDPFAGTGGIVIEALKSGCTVVSADIDPALRHGLIHLGAHHYLADARRLPFANKSFDAIATEPPYHEEAKSLVTEVLNEMYRLLKEGGRLAIMCAAPQADGLRHASTSMRLESYLDSPVNRKGLDVVVLAWQKKLAIESEA